MKHFSFFLLTMLLCIGCGKQAPAGYQNPIFPKCGPDPWTIFHNGNYYYMLSYDTSGANIGWYWGAAGGGSFTSLAHKAWLALPNNLFPSQGGAPFLGLPGWEDTTGIVPVGVNPEDGEWYTLQGLKIGKKPTTAGVYIHNGRKVVIK